MKHRILTALACGTLLASVSVAAPATAHGDYEPRPPKAGEPETIATGLNGPLSLEVDGRRVSFVSENFAGELSRIGRDGSVTTRASAPGGEISAVSSSRGTVYYAQLAIGEQGYTASALMALEGDGEPRQVADIFAYETESNPDQVNSYGFEGLTEECIAEVSAVNPQFAAVAEPYEGRVDSHPFATLPTRRGIFVADAGANAILRVKLDGTVSTVAVLPALAPVTVTTEIAASQELPDCVVGSTFTAEPVPTDVEWGPDGWLYVTSLPGGPEDASLGARGSVLKVNPWSGEVVTVAAGFVGATNLAVSTRTGNIYVAELFGGEGGTGQVSVLTRGSTTPTPLIALPSPAAIELRKGKLYVTTNVFAPDAGEVVIVPLKEKHRGGGYHSFSDEDSASAETETEAETE
ncbi:ScyD/ScyE family protein [Microbacteriaceae bacterium 4G12]